MNNYCTNCGKKLKESDLVCNKCKTPIVDLEKNHLMENKGSLPLVFISIVVVFIMYALYLVFVKFN